MHSEGIVPLIQEFKIHLMPKKEHAEIVIKKLINVLDTVPELAELVLEFKFLHDCNEFYSYGLVPKVVIYLKPGKENLDAAIELLNTHLADHVKDGLNQTPRFNQKINNLVYYSNGDSHCKILAQSLGPTVFNAWFKNKGVFFRDFEELTAEKESKKGFFCKVSQFIENFWCKISVTS